MSIFVIICILVSGVCAIINYSLNKPSKSGKKSQPSKNVEKNNTKNTVRKQPSPTVPKPKTTVPKPQPAPKSVKKFTVNGVSFKMIKVEGGTFTMGATAEQGEDAWDWEKPAHQVTLSSYYMGETQVTQALWQTVMGYNPSHFKGDDNNPVEKVSWDDCQVFINKLNQLTGRNFKLPTEAQWEYAARGGNQSQGYKYAGSNTVDAVAWYEDNSNGTTHPVAQKQPNELGLYDMNGNVCECCSDLYSDYVDVAQKNPKGAILGNFRVLRGGSWGNGVRYMRISCRNGIATIIRDNRGGLRLAM